MARGRLVLDLPTEAISKGAGASEAPGQTKVGVLSK